MPPRSSTIEPEKQYDTIRSYWIAYHTCGKFPDIFGREFYNVVGMVLEGVPIENINTVHVDRESVIEAFTEIVCEGRKNANTDTKNRDAGEERTRKSTNRKSVRAPKRKKGRVGKGNRRTNT